MMPDAAAPTAPPGPYRIVVHGHARARSALLHAIRHQHLAQAYLFEGPPAVGKRTLARWLAQALACTDAGQRPCGACDACRRLARGAWPDLHAVDAPLRIEAVRALRSALALAPAEGRYRLALLPEMERASPGAANALLKTLEEPPPHAVLVLTSADPAAVPATIRSRCRTVALRPLGLAELAGALADGWGQDPEQAALLARLSGGRIGWAVRAAEEPRLLGEREAWLAALGRLRGSAPAARLALAAELARGPEALADGLAVWSGWWRDVLLAAFGRPEAVTNHDRLAEVAADADRHGPRAALGALRAIEQARAALEARVGAQLTLDVLLAALP
jgi:DNA polymerase-3 subunit delta'